jgi:hypothetical protein
MPRLPDAEAARRALNAEIKAGRIRVSTVVQRGDSPLRGYALKLFENVETGRIVAEAFLQGAKRYVAAPPVPSFYLLARRDNPSAFYRVRDYDRALRLAGVYLS